MTATRRSFVTATAAAAGAMIGFPHVARAAGAVLTFSSWLPPSHPTVVGAYRPWMAEIAERTEGRVAVRMLGKPLGGAPAHFDLVREGVADLAYGLHSFTPGAKFLLTRLAEFSFLGDDAATLSTAYWKTYTSMFAAANEHDGAQLLALYCHGPGAIHTVERPIRSAADLSGLKLRVPGGYVGSLVERMGAIPLLTPSGEVYELLSNRVADGVTFTLEALTAFKLTGLLKHTTTLPGGIYNTSWFLVANPAKWQELEARDRETIAALSGEAFARRVGAVWTQADSTALGKIREAGIEMASASPELVGAIKPLAGALERSWIEEAAGRGVDAGAALSAVRAATGVKLPA